MNTPIRITDQTWPISTTPLVSVFNWVYNHKDFIRDSIESILTQETTFPVEIIIQDDASNDGTREIIKEYQNKYPHLFNNILFAENQYSQGKSIMNGLFEKPRGKYIALAHGDDYWTDPLKLQKQLDFLEKNIKVSCLFTNCQWLQPDGSLQNYEFGHASFNKMNRKNQISALLLSEKWLPVLTMVFRKTDIVGYERFIRKAQKYRLKNQVHLPGDFLLFLQLIENGRFEFLNDVTAVYRVNPMGMSRSSMVKDESLVKRGMYKIKVDWALKHFLFKEVLLLFLKEILRTNENFIGRVKIKKWINKEFVMSVA